VLFFLVGIEDVIGQGSNRRRLRSRCPASSILLEIVWNRHVVSDYGCYKGRCWSRCSGVSGVSFQIGKILKFRKAAMNQRFLHFVFRRLGFLVTFLVPFFGNGAIRQMGRLRITSTCHVSLMNNAVKIGTVQALAPLFTVNS